jgi:hypothetical protein
VDRLLRARACAPDASVPTVKAQSSVSPYKGKKSGAFQKSVNFAMGTARIVRISGKISPACRGYRRKRRSRLRVPKAPSTKFSKISPKLKKR